MMRATYLAWQSWLIEGGDGCLLIDPLLGDDVGRGPRGKRLTFLFYPPRRFTWPRFPPVDAVLISHEHEDHFNVPSLARIDRAIPIHLSERSSIAARTMLAEMGFTVELVCPEEPLQVGDLQLTPFAPQHVAADLGDEWDTLAYLVRHGDGNFFSNVDVPISPRMRAAVDAAPGTTLCYVAMTLGRWQPGVEGPRHAREMHGAGAAVQARPDGGEALACLLDGERLTPRPGQSFSLRGGIIRQVEQSPFLGVAPQAEWGPRQSLWRDPDQPFLPITELVEMTDEVDAEIESGLARIAEYLYGSSLQRKLYSMTAGERGGRKAALLWILLCDTDGSAYAYEYQPERCGFVRAEVPDDFQQRYLAVITCYACDLLALLRGVIEPRAMSRSVAEFTAIPGFAFQSEVLWPFFHPLRHPDLCLAQYRRAYADEAGAPILVRRR